MKSLIALSAEHSRIVSELMESDGEITPEQEAVLAAMVTKVDDCALFLKRLRAESDFFKDQAVVYADMAKRLESKAKWFESYIKTVVAASVDGELAGQTTKFVLQNNPAKVAIDDETQIPADYFAVEMVTKLDKRRVLDDLKGGVPVPGCRLERDQRLVAKANSSLLKPRKEEESA